MLWVFCIFILETIKDIGDVSWLKITVIGITGLVGVTSAFRFYLDSTRQVYIHRSRFPDNNAHKLKKYIFNTEFLQCYDYCSCQRTIATG